MFDLDYQILALKNQKVADRKKIFSKKLRSKYNSQAISTCCNKLHGLSYDDSRAVSSAKTAILHRTSSGSQLMLKKKTSRYNSEAFQS